MSYRGAVALITLPLALLAGCASPGLPYKPEAPGVSAAISADYTVLADRVRVEIDTRGARLEDLQIVKVDGSAVHPLTIEYPAFRTNSGVSFGIGVGGVGYSGGGVAMGTGVGVGTSVPVGEPRADGYTVAYFPLDQLGPAPWRMRILLTRLGPAFFVLGGGAGATK